MRNDGWEMTDKMLQKKPDITQRVICQMSQTWTRRNRRLNRHDDKRGQSFKGQPGLQTTRNKKRKGKIAGIRCEARSRGRSSPTLWIFESAKRPDDRVDYCLDCSSLPQWKH